MGRLINIDNGGTLTDFCVVDGDRVHRTKTVTTPYDLSRCLFDGLAKVSRALYGEEDVQRLNHTLGTDKPLLQQYLSSLRRVFTLHLGNSYKTQGPAALSGAYGNRKGVGILDADSPMRDFVIGLISAKPHISANASQPVQMPGSPSSSAIAASVCISNT